MKTLEHRGCRLHYTVQGEGPPVLMIQGAGLHGEGWRPQIDGLSTRYRCLSFDNRGMAKSQPLGCRLSVEQMAEDALALMDAEGWDSAHVAGHSLGGLIAQHIALTARHRVRSLSLLCTFARGADVTRLSPWMIWTGIRTRLGTLRSRRRAFLNMVMPGEFLAANNREALAERLEPIFGHDLAVQPAVVMRQLIAMQKYESASRLSELSGLPALVVSAKEDRIAPPELGRAIASGISGARYVEIPAASHGVSIQCPEEINRLLGNHFSDAEKTNRSPGM